MYKTRYEGLKAGTWQPQIQRRVQCGVDGCDRIARYRRPLDLCGAHHQQMERGVPFTPIRQLNRMVDGFKKCTRCGEVLPRSAYNKRGSQQTPECKACWSILNRANRYKVSFDEMKAMLAQPCAGCGDAIKHRLYVDHCHDCEAVRGILCVRCNTLLTTHATPTILRTLAEYLEAHSVDH